MALVEERGLDDVVAMLARIAERYQVQAADHGDSRGVTQFGAAADKLDELSWKVPGKAGKLEVHPWAK